MRAVIQRVSQASVSIEHQIVGAINTGFVVLLGIEANDNEEDVKWLSAKIVSMRIFNDSQGLMNLALKEVQGDLLLISQFTLFASTKKETDLRFYNQPSLILPFLCIKNDRSIRKRFKQTDTNWSIWCRHASKLM